MAPRGRSRAKLSSVRQQIDHIDLRLLQLINQRARLALDIGRIKKRRKWPVFDPSREAFVLRRVALVNRGPLSARAVEHIFQAILRECRRRERASSTRRTTR